MFFIPSLFKNIKVYISIFLFIAIGIVAQISVSASSQGDDERASLLKLRDSVNKYYYTFDIKNLKKLVGESEKNISFYPNNYYSYYYNGIVRYCLGRVVYNSNSDLAYEYFDTALEMFEKAHQIQNNPVSLAMISACYGKLSSLSPIRAIFLGHKAKNRIYDAYKTSPDNPKILIVAATHLMHVPAIYGGDRKRAKALLSKSLDINSKIIEQDIFELSWADNCEIYAYLAQLEILNENIESARMYMKKALDLKPNYGFVIVDLENQIKSMK